MEYLKLFENHSLYEDYVEEGMLKPNVSHCIYENDVHYNPGTWADEYLTIESLEDNNTIRLKATSTTAAKTVSVSTDNGETWTEYTSTIDNGTALATLNKGKRLLIKGQNGTYGTGSSYNQFISTGQFDVKGNIMSLLFGDDFRGEKTFNGEYTFKNLFSNNANLISAKWLFLPAETLTYGCYANMFQYCSGLEAAPLLPATTLAGGCYNFMFGGCEQLKTAPELKATELKNDCYANMFRGCTSLTAAPELPALTLANNCYYCMFYSCHGLNYIKAMFTTTPSDTYTDSWVIGVSSTGTFVKNSAAAWNVTGESGIPEGWTVQTASE